jgi:hypothetical protein
MCVSGILKCTSLPESEFLTAVYHHKQAIIVIFSLSTLQLRSSSNNCFYAHDESMGIYNCKASHGGQIKKRKDLL